MSSNEIEFFTSISGEEDLKLSKRPMFIGMI